MTEQSDENPFEQGDDKAFVSFVEDYLDRGGHRLRGLSAKDYVAKCRARWQACETDEVFKVKLLMDKLVWDQRKEELKPPPGFEDVSRAEEPAEDLYCTAMGLVLPDGSFVGAPNGHDPTPKNPESRRSFALAVPSRIPVDEPDEPEPTPYLLALFDVLGFSKRLEAVGLAQMHDLYKSLIRVALEPHVARDQWTRMIVRLSGDLYSPGMFWLPIRYAYFSDSLLLWVTCQPELVAAFLDRVLNVFCEALRLDLPLRGAVAAGVGILHKKSNTFLADALVEAARLHDAQQWIGAACGASVRSESLHIPFSPIQVHMYHAPLKDARASDLLSGLVLDWPRRWREKYGVSAHEAVSRLRAPGFEVYYDTTLAFIDHSDRDPEWFIKMLSEPESENA